MRFDTEVLKLEKMGITGDNLHGMIQNVGTHPVDLFVREVIQNSLDAASGQGEPIIQFQTGSFRSDALAEAIPLLVHNMKLTDRPEECPYLLVKDINCTGLIGDLDSDLAHDRPGQPQNLYNLVYDAMNPRKDKGAGGSWGIGKTVYFRFGSGMVFYYSRVEVDEGAFQSRLVGVLAEKKSESNKSLLEDQPKSRGIAFFGRHKSEHHESTIPIIDETEIKEFLDIFDIQPYAQFETGTTVIIPFINEESLLEDQRWTSDETKPSWYKDLGSFIKESVWKWYFPRLENQKYKGKSFSCQVNGDQLDPNVCHPIYRRLTEMYNKAIEHQEHSQNGLTCKPIKLRGGHIVGSFIWKMFDKNELLMVEPNNAPSPFVRFDSEDADDQSNPAIVLFTRRPGMIISYEIGNKPWVESGLQIEDGQYLIGIFVLNSDVHIESESLEEYFRSSEKADHLKWDDHSSEDFKEISSIKPLKRITNNIRRTLKEHYSSKTDSDETAIHGRLAGHLGKMLLPPEHFGRRHGSINNSESSGGGGSSRGKGYSFKITNVRHLSNGMILELMMVFGKQDMELFIDFKVAMPQGSINAQSWEKQGNNFPVRLELAKIQTVKIGNNRNKQNNVFIYDFRQEKPIVDNHSLVSITPDVTAKGTIGRLSFTNLTQSPHEVGIMLRFSVLDPSFEMELHPGAKAGESSE